MSMLGPFTNFHEMNLDWLLEEWRETKEAIIGDQSQWKEFKSEMTAAWEKYKKDTSEQLNNDIADIVTANSSFQKAIKLKIDEQNTAIDDLKKYCKDYFKNLNINAEIDAKIDEMVTDGSFLRIIGNTVTNTVNQWMNKHITNPTDPVIDKSLSINNAAADARTVGLLGAWERSTETFNMIDMSPNEFVRPGFYTVKASDIEGLDNIKQRNMIVMFKSDKDTGLQLLYSYNPTNTYDSVSYIRYFSLGDDGLRRFSQWLPSPVFFSATGTNGVINASAFDYFAMLNRIKYGTDRSTEQDVFPNVLLKPGYYSYTKEYVTNSSFFVGNGISRSDVKDYNYILAFNDGESEIQMFFSSDGETDISTYLRAVKKQGTGYVYTSWKTFTSARAGIDYTLSKSGVAADAKTVGDVSFITRWLFNSNSVDPNTITKPGSYFYTNNDSEFFKDSVVELKSNNILCAFSGNGSNFIQILYCIDTSQNIVASYTRWKDSENNFGAWVKNAVDTAKVDVDATLSRAGEAADAGAIGDYASLDRYSLSGKPKTKPNPNTCLLPGTYYYDASDKGNFGETGVLLKDRNILIVSSCGRNVVQQSLFVWNSADDTFMYWRFIINGNVIGKWHDASSIYTDKSLSDPKYAANAGAVGEKAFLTRESNIDFNKIETSITKPGIYYIDTTTIKDEQILYFLDVSKAWIIYLPLPGTKANSWELHVIYENETEKVFYGKLNSTSHRFEWIEQFNKIEKTIDDNILTIHTLDFGVNGVYHFPLDVNVQINLGDFSYQLSNPLLIVTPSYTSDNGWFSIVDIYSTNARDTPYYKKLGIAFNHLNPDMDAYYVIEYN